MSDESAAGTSLHALQKHLWRHRQEVGGCQNVGCAVLINGPVDFDQLRAALDRAVERRDILRTDFPLLPGTSIPVQVVRAASGAGLERQDLGAGATDRDAAIDSLFAEQLAAPFDPSDCGAGRATLVSFSPSSHALLLCQPALRADAGSCWNLACVLAADLNGAAPPAADDEDPVQSADVAEWQDEMFESEDAAAGLAHWQEVLGARAPDARLQLEQTPQQSDSFQPRQRGRAITRDLGAAVTSLAKAQGVSRSAVYLAAWQVLLARHSEQDELCLGVASAGRLYEGIEDAIGLLQKTLPIGCRIDRAATFAAMLANADAAEDAASSQHEFFDLDRLAGFSESQSPAFAFQYYPAVDPVAAGAATFALQRSYSCTERFTVALAVESTAAGEATRIAYDPSLYSEGYLDALLEQLHGLLAAACQDPQRPVGALDMVGAKQRTRLLDEFARVPGETPSSPTLHELFAEVAARTPDATAVTGEGDQITYGELDRRANQLARHLQTLGVAPGTFVGIYMHSGVQMILAILATQKAGGAYLPLPPTYPDERIGFMLEDTEAPVVLTVRQVAASMPGSAAMAVVVEDEWETIGSLDPAALPSVAGPDDPAYVIYTSGSTGKPKGVPILHRNLAHSIGARLLYYSRPVERYLLLSSFAFDSSVPGIFWTLSQGGTIVFPPRDFGRDLSTLPRLIAEAGVTHMLGLPSLYSAIQSCAKPGQLNSLTTVVIAGESANVEVLGAHYALLPGAELHNEYGPTEGTVWSSVFNCSTPCDRPTVPIGQPVPGTSAYILDDSGAPCPIGIPGELHVGGAGVAPGYHNRPELTAERFIDNPFGPGRLYRTGDVTRFLPDGQIEFLGRQDHQVKIRGFRIELEEIENALLVHAAVQEAVVVAREEKPGDKRLVGYVTPAAGAAPDSSRLREYLRNTLPDYMVPISIDTLEAMPLLPNGKVDRAALPAPRGSEAADGAGHVEPRTPLERVVALVWCDVLGCDQVSIEDDFFDLGGHSLLATQLFARLVDYLDIDVPLRAIFDHRTVASLCQRVLADDGDHARLEETAKQLLEELQADESDAESD